MNNPEIKRVYAYKTTDGKIFSGKDGSVLAKRHQGWLNDRLKLDRFDLFLRNLFCMKLVTDEGAAHEEQAFCDAIMEDVVIDADDGDFKVEISTLLLDLYGFIGPDKWLGIHKHLNKEEEVNK